MCGASRSCAAFVREGRTYGVLLDGTAGGNSMVGSSSMDRQVLLMDNIRGNRTSRTMRRRG